MSLSVAPACHAQNVDGGRSKTAAESTKIGSAQARQLLCFSGNM
jgi:hypothetical protein